MFPTYLLHLIDPLLTFLIIWWALKANKASDRFATYFLSYPRHSPSLWRAEHSGSSQQWDSWRQTSTRRHVSSASRRSSHAWTWKSHRCWWRCSRPSPRRTRSLATVWELHSSCHGDPRSFDRWQRTLAINKGNWRCTISTRRETHLWFATTFLTWPWKAYKIQENSYYLCMRLHVKLCSLGTLFKLNINYVFTNNPIN